MRISLPASALSLGLAALLASAVPAHAVLPAQTFVSASGSDSNPCSEAMPCATFQHAVNNTAIGGKVDAMTVGNFGPIVIKNSITIDGRSLGTVVEATAGAVAISVEATSTSQVVLRNVSIEGAGTGGDAIKFSNGGALVVDGCFIGGFTGTAIDDEAFASPTYNGSNLVLKNTTIVGSDLALLINGSYLASVTLDHVSATGLNPSAIAITNCSNEANVVVNDSAFVTAIPDSGAGNGLSIDKTCPTTSVMMERSTIFGFGYGVTLLSGTVNIDSSTFLKNNRAAYVQNGSTLTLSNNNFYYNHYSPYCVATTAGHTAILTAGNNRVTVDPGGSFQTCSATGPFHLQ